VAKRRVGSLSHGMIKRLGVAQAFLGSPEVILLDEPTAGLDPANARQVRDLVKQLQHSATILVSSHNLVEVQELCDHVAILNHGRLVLAGSVEEITRAHRECQVDLSRALRDGERQRLTAVRGVRSVEPISLPGAGQNHVAQTAGYVVRLDLSAEGLDQDAVTAALLREILDMGITPRRLLEGRSLENQFLEVTGAAEDRSARNGGTDAQGKA